VSKREDGYYWIRCQGRWEPAEWYEGQWFVISSVRALPKVVIEKIGHRIEQPLYDPLEDWV
jgi:hypothetical protein